MNPERFEIMVKESYNKARAGRDVRCWDDLSEEEQRVLMEMAAELTASSQDTVIPVDGLSNDELDALLVGDTLMFVPIEALRSTLKELVRELLALRGERENRLLSDETIDQLSINALQVQTRRYISFLKEARGLPAEV